MADNTRKAIRFEMDARDHRGYMDAIKRMDKEAKTKLRDDVAEISKWCAAEIRAAAAKAPYPKQAIALSKTVRSKKDRVPYITVGGARKVFSNGATAGQAIVGSEFGAYPRSEAGSFPQGGRKYPYRSVREGRGNAGYWIFPTLKKNQATITRLWKESVDHVLRYW